MSAPRIVEIGGARFGAEGKLALIAGPCVIESEELTLRTAEAIRRIAEKLGVPFVFKSSYRKDNRSSVEFFEGPGLEAGLAVLDRVKREVGVPVLSDVHTPAQAAPAAEVLDALQIPAYLSQQTELLLAAARTGKAINIKKGQFVAPEDLIHSVRKVESAGNRNILLTERGSCFGYRTLVVDMRSLAVLRGHGYPAVFDVTHSVRVYGKPSADPAGGTPEHIPLLARAGVAAGCDALFIETHPDPSRALCDAASMLPLARLEKLLAQLLRVHEASRAEDA
ncbi:MAG: 3-deoxy-8-phosphooctulonate synthase [Candidatus Eisenbacteria bacterium]|nr:3-deoxy-8-phosphooctulonate synthase [Candidatus Eisenbacteria bacterium]